LRGGARPTALGHDGGNGGNGGQSTALGRAVVVAWSVLLGFAIPGLVLLTEFGLAYWPPYAALLGTTVALGVAFLGIAVLCSTALREKTHALGATLLAWVWFVLVYDLLGLGVVAAVDLSACAVGAIVLANPGWTCRVLAFGLLGPGGTSGFGAVGATAGLSPSPLDGGLVVWMVLPVALAAIVVRRRRVG
jgi:Cu-processing system permease protein